MAGLEGQGQGHLKFKLNTWIWEMFVSVLILFIPFHRTHMQDLKDVTNNVHYENYRSKKLAAVTCNGSERFCAVFNPKLERRHEQMKRNLEAQYKELEEKRRVFEDEKANWEAQQRILEQQKLDASK
ncbi:hypothetical protein XENOCAPTIV_029588 [Xenoophorus captivus]|uniref:Septin-type G domain-containing protein n=1 Tax=Xenoophorus captivus TaxID=1517983 RepID=A0ABV0RPC5_9TELE